MLSNFLNLRFISLLAASAFVCGAAWADENPIHLFNGKDLAGWKKPTGTWQVAGGVSLDPANPEKLILKAGQGVLVNNPEGHTSDLVTEAEFGDFEGHFEFLISKHSNSGIYLMGRYELQIYDSFGVEKDAYPGIECGGIYPRWINNQNVDGYSPDVNASKPPGQWQTFEVIFRAPRFDAAGKKIANAVLVKVVQNGKLIHQNLELKGPTRGPISEQEAAKGPIRLQGDHGPVAFRHLIVKPLKGAAHP